MAYATISDVFKRFPPIHTMVGTGPNDVSSVDVSSIYIYDADSYVNAFLGARYTIPLTAEPLVTMLSSDIAIFRMCQDRMPRIPDYIKGRFDHVNSLLGMLRDGQMILSSSQSIVTDGNQEAWTGNQNYHPVFSTVLDPLDQSVDQDHVDAERNVRNGDSS